MGRWVSLKAAAERLGVSEDTVRRKLKAGELKGRQEKMVRGFRWLVELPETAEARTYAGAEAERSGTEHTLLREMIERCEQTVTRMETTQEHLWEELAARRREVSELHILLQRAQDREQRPPVSLPAGRDHLSLAESLARMLLSMQQSRWWKAVWRP